MSINETVRKAKSGDSLAKEELCNKYRRLIHKISWRYPHMNHEDLVQEGFLGVLDAIESYKEGKGATFFTWVYWQVRGRITQATRRHRSEYSLDYSFNGMSGTLLDNIEDPSSVWEPEQEFPTLLDAVRIVRECTNTARSYKMVSDRIGIQGEPMDNGSVAVKYGVSKQSASNCMKRFKNQARRKFPELAELL